MLNSTIPSTREVRPFYKKKKLDHSNIIADWAKANTQIWKCHCLEMYGQTFGVHVRHEGLL